MSFFVFVFLKKDINLNEISPNSRSTYKTKQAHFQVHSAISWAIIQYASGHTPLWGSPRPSTGVATPLHGDGHASKAQQDGASQSCTAIRGECALEYRKVYQSIIQPKAI